MMIYYNSRELSDNLNVNLSKWKRWVREFLPPDPLGGLQSGYARQFNLKEAFRVFLGGYLVSALKFTIPEARQILTDLDNWLKSEGFYALRPQYESQMFGNGQVLRIYIFCGADKGFVYIIQRIKKNEILEQDGSRLERYDQSFISTQKNQLFTEAIAGGRILYIQTLYLNYFLANVLPNAKK